MAHLVTGEADNRREQGVGFLRRLLMGVACFSLTLASIDPVASVLAVSITEARVWLIEGRTEAVPGWKV